MEPNLSDLCPQATKALLLLPTTVHTPVKLFFNDIITFKTKHGYQLQPEDDIR